MNEFRRDPITGRCVIISSHRDARPNQFQREATAAADNSATSCPFCEGQLDTPPMVASYGADKERTWQVCVVPNLYPVLDPPTEIRSHHDEGSDLFDSIPAEGLHEVVIESPFHVTRASDLTLEQFTLMLRAYRDRMRFMRENDRVVYVQTMRNSGEDAGASLKHSHSQIFGLPFVPEQIQQELDGAYQYFSQKDRCVFCDTVAAEIKSRVRIVAETEDFVAWCPFASRFGFETWIAPRRHAARFEDSRDSLLEKLGSLFRLVIRQIEQHPRIHAFNYLIHSLPFDTDRHDHYHWHIEIVPRIAKQAGFEWGTRIHINTIAPERAANVLRLDN